MHVLHESLFVFNRWVGFFLTVQRTRVRLTEDVAVEEGVDVGINGCSSLCLNSTVAG